MPNMNVDGAKYLPIPKISQSPNLGYIADVEPGNWFTALQPIKPTAPPGTRVRQREIIPGENVIWQPKGNEQYGFWLLRQFVESWDLLHVIIDTVCDRICNEPWEVRLVREAGELNAQYKKRNASDKQLAKIRDFVTYPDGFHHFSDWLRMWIEDMLVIDAVALYMERDLKGRIASVIPVDGGTINRCITDQGLTPNDGKSIAYQQILYGTPAVDLTTNDLIYYISNERTWQRYGCSPVQKIVTTVATGIRRQQFTLKYFTEGTMPEALCFLPAELPIKRIKEVQDWFDSVMAGDLGKRRRLTFLPGFGQVGKGQANPNVVFPKEVLLKEPLDEWLWQVACYAIGTTPQAMLKMMNRATAQQSAESSEEEGLEPKKRRVERIMNLLIQEKMGQPNYEFAYTERQETDGLKQAQINQIYTAETPIKRINEVREELGMDPDPSPEANELGVMTPNGWMPLTGGIVPHGLGGSDPLELNETGKDKQKVDSDNAKAKAQAAASANGDDKKGKSKKVAKNLEGKHTLGVASSHPHLTLARTNLHAAVLKVFRRQKEKAQDKAGSLLKVFKLKKESSKDDSETIADAIWNEIEKEFDSLPAQASAALETAAKLGLANAIAQLGISDSDMISSLNAAASEWARDRAAEMVGMKYDDAGDLVKNPNAKWNIAETTRDDLRKIISDAFAQETTTANLISSVQDALADEDVFSESRAALIARTETVNAAVKANFEGWQTSGLVLSVEWDTSSESPCDDCDDNDGVVVKIGQAFPSGDLYPPLHPNCACLLMTAELADEV